MNFGLSPEHFSLLDSLLITPLKKENIDVWIFGSRAREDFQKFSDIDILFEAKKPIPSGLLFSITEALEESRLPYKVDLVNIDDLAESYRENILRDRIKL